jgi:protocatechuate 3,4-dioxygenase beta subunit
VTTGVVRSDIRSSFGGIGSSVATGVPLSITLNLFNTNNNCSALANAAVYLWHCTADGNYSLYSNGVMNENYLRGVQVSNASGQVTFLSIFPGCYSGRYPHIHFEIYQTLGMATQYRNAILTSQMALPRDVCTTVYSGGAPGYAASLSNLASVQVTTDNVFGDNTTAQITAMTPATTGSVAAGYNALIAVGVAVS